MVKKDKKSKTKTTKSSEKTGQEDQKPPEEAFVEEIEKDPRTVRIVLEKYENLMPLGEEPTVHSVCQHLDNIVCETSKIPFVDEMIVDQFFEIILNANSPKDLDILTSRPVTITVNQTMNQKPAEEQPTEELILRAQSSIESALTLYEALTGDKVDMVSIELNQSKKSKKKKDQKRKSSASGSKGSVKDKGKKKTSSDRSSKSSKASKGSKGSKKDKKGPPKSVAQTADVKVYGYCTLDLLPLLFGCTCFKESLPLNLMETHLDDRMTTFKKPPEIIVSVYLDKPFEFSCRTSVLGLTVESISNIPSVMKPELDYQICAILPLLAKPKHATQVTGRHKTEQSNYKKKLWPEQLTNLPWPTKYDLVEDIQNVKHINNFTSNNILTRDKPRIEFNCMKRNFLLRDGHLALYDHIKKYRKLVVEIYALTGDPTKTSSLQMSNKSKASELDNKGKNKKKKDKKSDKTSKGSSGNKSKQNKDQEFLHLMAVLDVSALLYPGTERTRVAAQLTTYHEQEALQAGLEDSFFVPRPPEVVETAVDAGKAKKGKKEGKKGKKGGSKSSKSSKSGSKSSKGSKGSKKSKGSKASKPDKVDLKESLPPEPQPKPPPEPSLKIFNESGEPTFIVVEIELTEPLLERRNLEDLERSFDQLIHSKPTTPKINTDVMFSEKYRKIVIEEVVAEVKKCYYHYVEDKNLCHCPDQTDFLTYLRRVGLYQNLVYSLINAATSIVRDKMTPADILQNRSKYQQFIEEVYISLMGEINDILHRMAMRDRPAEGTTGVSMVQKPSTNVLLFYAKEATEVEKIDLAQKYHLERLIIDEHDPCPWFDYAIFQNERLGPAESSLCIEEVLARNKYHKHSLLINGLISADKGQKEVAETFLLSLAVQYSLWAEAWTALYLFYEKQENHEGMDMSREKALNYLDDPRFQPDYVMCTDDLAWTTMGCPNTMFFRLAVLLLKYRMYHWAEYALSHELKHTGDVHYFLAVGCYYQRHYHHALEHLKKAKELRGSVLFSRGPFENTQCANLEHDYGVASLAGHCYLAIGELQEAADEYRHIMESFERPDDMHLVHLNYSKVLSLLGHKQEAKKIMLIACKHNPTPYTWTSCGKLYFEQNDLLSAEECFSEAVMLDDTIPETWAYLSLINARMLYIQEAEFCHRLAVKNNVDEELLKKVETELEENKAKDTYSVL